jgi:3-carboxy-cis,cis-muconate cycloisomerase
MRAIFSDEGCVAGMLEFEAALARAQSALGLIPGDAGPAIAACCRPEHIDSERLHAGAASAGNLALPLVRELTAAVAREHPHAARFVHWGATSQDAIDTGLVLQMRAALAAIETDYTLLSQVLAELARRERDTLVAGRTWLQQAVPITFGVKVAGWLSAVERDRVRLAAARERALVLQLGGAAGTLASMGRRGPDVAAAVAASLALAVPDIPWHTQRDRIAEIAAVLGIAVGTLGKIARDVALMMQTELGEAYEPAAPGRGGSSTMPQKRNPVGAAVALAAALRVPGLVATLLSASVQEHERGLGGWHAEWEVLPEIFTLTDGALGRMLDVISGLELDRDRMRDNLGATRGLLAAEGVALALASTLGKQQAHELVEQACRKAVSERRHLRDVLTDIPAVRERLHDSDLDTLFDPARATGCAAAWIESTLAARRD